MLGSLIANFYRNSTLESGRQGRVVGKCRQIKVLLKNVSAQKPYVGEREREGGRESLSPTPAVSATDGLEEQEPVWRGLHDHWRRCVYTGCV